MSYTIYALSLKVSSPITFTALSPFFNECEGVNQLEMCKAINHIVKTFVINQLIHISKEGEIRTRDTSIIAYVYGHRYMVHKLYLMS